MMFVHWSVLNPLSLSTWSVGNSVGPNYPQPLKKLPSLSGDSKDGSEEGKDVCPQPQLSKQGT